MKKKLDEARRRIQAGEGGQDDDKDEPEQEVAELSTYKSSADYPKDVLPTQLKVDMEKEALLVPINGQHVPFHISMIKNITMPEQDRATWMRINFYIPGSVGGKDVPATVQKLVTKHGDQAVFIKELTYRSLDSKNLTQVNMLFQELRKRVKQREQKAEQEKNLVVQSKLIKIKDQRVPRLQDLTMRPQLSGRKCIGALEAHQNGLRFTSNKGEILDIMYANIKHAIYQPCEKTTMVLVHFHLKDAIIIGKKKQKDVQFFTEVVEASMNLEGSKRYSYDPDELDDEQREREMRKRLNLAFKEFCQKVEKVAAHYDFSLQIDVPFRKSGFEGNHSKEMVLIQPTTHCLVNLTEMPFFVITLSEIDHAHFERVSYATKNFDLTFIFKDFTVVPRTITAIDIKYMDVIQDWLNVVEITYTQGAMSMNWTALMEQVIDYTVYVPDMTFHCPI
jgi:nucleosome binding factor SPN SPT16 subunit